MEANITNYVSIPLPCSVYAEFVKRGVDQPNRMIESVITDFLERTRLDDIWNEEYLTSALEEEVEFGDPGKGLQWQNVFLRNGTCLRMRYQRKEHYAVVSNESINYSDRSYSPSQWVRKVAGGTNRNAWRDIWTQKPNSDEWTNAEDLRRQSLASSVAKGV